VYLQVGALVHSLDDAQVVLEVGNECVSLVGEVLRLLGDLPVEALQPFPGDTCIQTARGRTPSWIECEL
jgi:hypothetical protein